MRPVRPIRNKAVPLAPVWKKELEKKSSGMPRILVALSSCQLYEDRGWHDAARQTWLSEAKKLGIDYKFFFGRGAKEKEDVVVVDCHDGYFDLTSKQKEKIKWALFQNYDYVFSCLADCYASPERLLSSGFEKYDYFGDVYCHPGGVPYCQGGPGYFMSRAACEAVAAATSNYPNEDCWTGDILAGHPMARGDSKDFVWQGHLPGFGPSPTNTHITAHLSNADGGFRPELMWEKDRQWRGTGTGQ